MLKIYYLLKGFEKEIVDIKIYLIFFFKINFLFIKSLKG